MATPVIEIAPAVNRNAVAQLSDLGVLAEYHDSGNIEEDIQTLTSTDRWVATGNPLEAFLGAGMQGLTIGSRHHTLEHTYCVKRRFQHMAKSSTNTERRTLITLVYQRRPCVKAWETTEIGTLISMPTWWSWDDPPQSLTGGAPISIAIMQPSRQHIRRYPAVRLLSAEFEAIMGAIGKTNRVVFLGKSPDFWLLQNVRTKMLWGNTTTNDGVYEISLYFLGDPRRSHKIWDAKLRNNRPIPPASNSQKDMAAAHRISTKYLQTDDAFETLVPNQDPLEVCWLTPGA